MSPTRAHDTIIEEIAINAPADRIFEALTNPKECIKWWGQTGQFGWTHIESDLRPGGRLVMRGTGYGKPVSVTGVYRQIERPRLLVFTWLPDWQGDQTESIVRWDLEEKAGVTTVRLTHSGLTTETSRSSHRGWPSILGWLRAHVEGTV
jgi:uncharacterized protein YndB with AHSA1/START domain